MRQRVPRAPLIGLLLVLSCEGSLGDTSSDAQDVSPSIPSDGDGGSKPSTNNGGSDPTGNPGTGGDTVTNTGGGPPSSSNGGSQNTGGSPGQGGSGQVAMLVAHGHMGRTIISCDDGQTWVANQSDNMTTCWSQNGGPDCDHHAGAANGMTYGGGYFFATYGWGTPGGIRRSDDGVNWTSALSGTTFNGLAYGNGRIVTGARSPRVSSNNGSTWNAENSINTGFQPWNVREIGFANYDGGRFVMVGNDGDSRDIVVSNATGESWSQPAFPAECDISFYVGGGVVFGNGVILITQAGASAPYHACRSTDGGATWTAAAMPQGIRSSLVWTGSEFVGFSPGVMLRSANGLNWQTAAVTPANLQMEAVEVSDKGTFVGVSGEYANQQFYRSANGTTWTALAANAFVKSHVIRDIQFGWAKSSAQCPAQ